MILIAISWVYIFFTAINLGFVTNKLLALRQTNFVLTAVLGLFAATLLGSGWAFFGRINMEFHVALALLNIISLVVYRKGIIKLYGDFAYQFESLAWGLKVYLFAIGFLIIAQCASVPYVIDNETYYIQTIKWLNEYGFVKGLANLHFSLAQQSGWHVTQAVFNFSFLYQNFNDLSGFCLLLGNLFAIEKLNSYFRNSHKMYLVIGLLPLANLFFFQFISAPSPDIAVFVFTFILLSCFVENYKSCTAANFNLIVVLVLFLLYSKNTTLALVLVPVVLFAANYRLLAAHTAKPLLLCLLVLTLFLAKNMVVCGTAVFPSGSFDWAATDYAVPKEMEKVYYDQVKYYSYFTTPAQYDSMSALELFKRWLALPKLNGLFNKLAILLLLAAPLFIYRFYNKKAIWVLYSIMLVQLAVLFATAPQYRFFINFILFFSLFCFGCLFYGKKTIMALLYLSLLPVVVVLFLPVDLNRFSNYKFMQRVSNFSAANYMYPHKNTKYKTGFEPVKKGNLDFNSPLYNSFFWGTGDGALPCVNKLQLDYFEKYYHYRPQLRSGELKDGFYAQKTKPHEP